MSSRSSYSVATTVVLVVTFLPLLRWRRVAAHKETEGIRDNTTSSKNHRPQERSYTTTGKENTICRPEKVDGSNTLLQQEEDHPDRMPSFPGWEGALPSAWYSGCNVLRCVTLCCVILDKKVCSRRLE